MREFLAGFVAGGVVLGGVGALPAVRAVEAVEVAVRTEQFENAAIHVWTTTVPAGAHSEMHRHDHPRVVVALSDAEMQFLTPAGRTERAHWQAGHAYWLPAMPPGALHADVNAGQTEARLVVMEMKKE